MSGNVLLTVVIPVYNAELYISSALESLLDQSFSKWNCCIIDDCSTDNTLNIIESMIADDYRFKIIKLSNNTGSPSIVRNIALNLCKTKYVAFLDGDDIWMRDKIEEQIRFMESKDYALSYTGVATIDSLSKIQKKYKPKCDQRDIFRSLIRKNDIATSSVMINMRLLNTLSEPFFDESLRIAEDYDLYLRLASQFNIGCLSDLLVFWRNHSASLTKAPSKQIYTDLEKVFDKLKCYCDSSDKYELEMNLFKSRISYYKAKSHIENKDVISARSELFLYRFTSFPIFILWASLFFGLKPWGFFHKIKYKV